MSTIAPTQPVTPPQGPAAPALADVYRMDVDEFERIADLLKAERVELIDGFIVERGAMDPPHVLSSEKLRRKLDRMLPDGWFVREDKPVRCIALMNRRLISRSWKAIPIPTRIVPRRPPTWRL